MNQLTDNFYIDISRDKMTAFMHCKDSGVCKDLETDEASIRRFFDANNVLYGVDQTAVNQILSSHSNDLFPLQIAKGLAVVDGQDGYIKYELNLDTKHERTSEWDFRNVMRIPSVAKGQKLAVVINPKEGIEGIDVSGNTVQPKSGKPVKVRAGNNVVYREENMSFYAVTDGQISIVGRYIHVFPIYEVHETLSMKTGNLNFVGTIVIHGDVPNGFQVQAEGDIKIYGMVESATIIAGGSVYIAEGLAGQGSGLVKASGNVTIGYINQGTVETSSDLYVENSILHSECIAEGHIFCQRGNIIGGTLSAGKRIEAKDIGNRLSTITEIVFGVNKRISDKEAALKRQQKELEDKLRKLSIIGSKLEQQDISSNSKLRISLLRQKNSVKKVKEQLLHIESDLENINARIGSEKDADLIVRNFIHHNTIIAFGKYKKKIKTEYHYVKINLVNNEIMIHPLFD
ncbi:DUF342 domain-containing protein [Oceanobacillus massiliensis]|uniref:DUF342 domain-containing protein n=1 Tax=Oceanobacillus massiliensis TaxID=1465765 RepID=UPI00028A3995|nr:FapA family protein [Oceanobacillus massiliensis]